MLHSPCQILTSLLALCFMGTDVYCRRIPNVFPLAIAAAALADSVILWRLPGLWEAGIVLCTGLLLFRLGILGGGDVKALAAGALFVPGRLADLVVCTAAAGGVLAVAVLIWSLVKREKPGLIPYGVAIGTGILFCVWT